MTKRISELVRITPIMGQYGTGASSAVDPQRYMGGDFSVVVGARFGSTVTLGVTATAANYVQFSVLESTAASAAGSAISGATVTLGAATAAQARGLITGALSVSSNLTTAVTVNINGIDYWVRTAGAGSSGESVAAELSSNINGKSSAAGMPKLPHYRAVANYSATGVVRIEADDDLGTGLTIITTAAASTIAPWMQTVQGVIDIAASKLSTETPKYISLAVTTFNGTTAVFWGQVVRQPSGSPAMPGRVVQITT
jgi:hypothetical protein